MSTYCSRVPALLKPKDKKLVSKISPQVNIVPAACLSKKWENAYLGTNYDLYFTGWHQNPSTFYRHFDRKSSNLLWGYRFWNRVSCKDSRQESSRDQREALCAAHFWFCISEWLLSAVPLHSLASYKHPSLRKRTPTCTEEINVCWIWDVKIYHSNRKNICAATYF